MNRTLACRLVATFLVASLASHTAFAQPWITDLGTLDGDSTWAADINDQGQVIGSGLTSSGARHLFVWSANSGMTDLGNPFNAANIWPSAINNAGQAVGGYFNGGFRAWIRESGGSVVQLPIGNGFAEDINDAGQVVGSFRTFDNGWYTFHAFLWSPTGGLVDLGTLGASVPSSFAMGVNSAGQVVGMSRTSASSNDEHAFSWTASSGMIDLGTLGGSSSLAFAVNDLGEIVGRSLTTSNISHAFVWTAAQGMVDLGTLGGNTNTARTINNNGHIINTSYIPLPFNSEILHAFLWTPEQGMTDLGTLPDPPGTPSDAVAINANGQITGNSVSPKREWHPVLWSTATSSPIP